MKRRSRAGGEPIKTRRRKAMTLKRGIEQKTVRRRNSSDATHETEIARLTRELQDALQQQTATAEVLRVISRTPFNLQSVLDTLVQLAARLCDAEIVNVWRPKDGAYRLAASNQSKVYHENKEYLDTVAIEPDRGTVTGRSLLEGKTVQVHDVQAELDYNPNFASVVGPLFNQLHGGGFRTVLAVPLLNQGLAIGVIALTRARVHPFTQSQIELIQTFADQAVIAIENTRLFEAEQQRTRELTDSLQQQTATADVLRVIIRSAFNLQAVLNTLTESAARLCAADLGLIFQQDGDVLRLVANFGVSREAERYWLEHPVPVGRGSTSGRALLEGRAIRIPDVSDPEYRATRYQELAGYRSTLSVPLLRDGTTIGVFGLRRREPNPFTDKQAELVTTFADQAVIAIENARLLNELRESLQQQTATADVLKVISRSTFDLQTVLDTLV
jgi:GAF domain-containing protein